MRGCLLVVDAMDGRGGDPRRSWGIWARRSARDGAWVDPPIRACGGLEAECAVEGRSFGHGGRTFHFVVFLSVTNHGLAFLRATGGCSVSRTPANGSSDRKALHCTALISSLCNFAPRWAGRWQSMDNSTKILRNTEARDEARARLSLHIEHAATMMG